MLRRVSKRFELPSSSSRRRFTLDAPPGGATLTGGKVTITGGQIQIKADGVVDVDGALITLN